MTGAAADFPAALHEAALACHPQTPCTAVERVTVRLRRTRAGQLHLAFRLDADLDRLRVPAPRPAQAAEGLWRHTCCEVFVARHGASAYHEFNFSPSGEWAACAFERYRVPAPFPGAQDVMALDPPVTVAKGRSNLELRAVIRLDRLSPEHAIAGLALSVAVVAEDRDGSLSYWALRHPEGRPDFHHPQAFALALGGPASASPSGPVDGS